MLFVIVKKYYSDLIILSGLLPHDNLNIAFELASVISHLRRDLLICCERYGNVRLMAAKF